MHLVLHENLASLEARDGASQKVASLLSPLPPPLQPHIAFSPTLRRPRILL